MKSVCSIIFSPQRVCLICLVLLELSTSLNIIHTLPHTSDIVKEGGNTTLHCETDSPWFFCLWNSPQDDRHCAIQESEPVSVCSGDPGLVLHGTKTGCTLDIYNITREHHGTWLCLVNEIQHFKTQRQQVDLTVGRPAVVTWKNDLRSGELVVVEGETVNLTCSADRGLPAPTFSWTSAVNLTSTQGGGEVREEANGLISTAQTLQYTAKLNHSGLNISCVVDQIDNGGRVMYSSQTSLQLVVLPLLTQGLTLPERLGILSGILVSILLLILLICILVIVLITRSRRGRKYHIVDEYKNPSWIQNKTKQANLDKQLKYGDLETKLEKIKANRMTAPLLPEDRRVVFLPRQMASDPAYRHRHRSGPGRTRTHSKDDRRHGQGMVEENVSTSTDSEPGSLLNLLLPSSQRDQHKNPDMDSTSDEGRREHEDNIDIILHNNDSQNQDRYSTNSKLIKNGGKESLGYLEAKNPKTKDYRDISTSISKQSLSYTTTSDPKNKEYGVNLPLRSNVDTSDPKSKEFKEFTKSPSPCFIDTSECDPKNKECIDPSRDSRTTDPLNTTGSSNSKDSPNYLDTTIDSGYVTKDGNHTNLDETMGSDTTLEIEMHQPTTHLLTTGGLEGPTTHLLTPGGLQGLTTGSTIFDCDMGCFISVEEYREKYGETEQNHM